MRRFWAVLAAVAGAAVVLGVGSTAHAQFMDLMRFEHQPGPFPVPVAEAAGEFFAADAAGTSTIERMRLKGPVESITVKWNQARPSELDKGPQPYAEVSIRFDEHGMAASSSTSSAVGSDAASTQYTPAYADIAGKRLATELKASVIRNKVDAPQETFQHFEYDDQGRITKIRFEMAVPSQPKPVTTMEQTIERGSDGNITAIRMTREGQARTSQYDAEGRLAKTQINGIDLVVASWESPRSAALSGMVTQRLFSAVAFDDRGSIASWKGPPILGIVAEPRGTQLDYTNTVEYDDRGNWTRITTRCKRPDPAGEPAELTLIEYARTITCRAE